MIWSGIAIGFVLGIIVTLGVQSIISTRRWKD